MELCRTADIIISAAGSAGVIDRAHLGRGQTIVDIGLSPGPDGELLGDVDFDAAESLAAALTPKTTRSTQGVNVMTLKPKYKVADARPLADTTIVNAARYRARSLPIAGMLLRPEDRAEEQMTLLE